MKILELRFKNLNSLYGEWVIDFTDPHYISNGIFSLTGPTGSGKSTILDAICLALYGSTPRLGKITKSGNEIMSRQTGECYAEVLFESQAGVYRCHWEQRKARKSATGNLQDQEHQIADGITGKPIETKKSRVGRVIEEKTGMDFDRFTRSILLAQGGFDTFLKADVEQKSKILEQITGTEIYTEISRRVHERHREEGDKLNVLNAETAGIIILSPEQEEDIHNDLEGKQKQEIELTSDISETRKAITWVNSIEVLQKEIIAYGDEAAKLKADCDAFQSDRDRLELAIKAATLEGIYVRVTSLRKYQADDMFSFQRCEAVLPELELSSAAQYELLKAAERLSLEAKDERTTASPLIQKVRSLDQKIEDLKKAILSTTYACSHAGKEIEADRQARVKEHEKQVEAEKRLDAIELFLKKNAQDEWLISSLAGVQEQLRALLAVQREIANKQVALRHADATVAHAAKNLETTSKRCVLSKNELEKVSNQLELGKNYLNLLLGGKLLREYHTEKENLLREMGFIRRIEELEDLRVRLQDGKPCPLCGSYDHPFAEGNVPVPDEIEQKIEALTSVINGIDEQNIVMKSLEQAEKVARKNLNDAEKLEIDATNEKKLAELALVDLQDSLKKLRDDYQQLKQVVSEKLMPLGISDIPESDVEHLLETLKSRLQAWQNHVQQKTYIEKQLSIIDGEMKRLDAVIETQVNVLIEKQEHLEEVKNELVEATNQRKQLYGDKSPDDEELRLNKSINDAEKAERDARELNTKRQQQLISEKTTIESLKNRMEQRELELTKSEGDYLAGLESVGFVDESAFVEARLPQDIRERLSARAKKLDDAVTELKVKQEDRESRLSTEITKKLTEKTLEELESDFKDYEERQKNVRDDIATLKHQLNENSNTKERIKEKQFAIEAQKRECHRWAQLHELIGSSDGKKYRNFAQGLTFELMVSHANRQLEKMSDRYLLVRDEQEPLELNVVDNYQAGEVRSTQNLSGGESFIVSLALALGLSKMASRKVRVDSLFLDEGFGTLDEDALETALDTLSGLHQDGKLIGIISHVSALKERISTQIEITPVFGGRSSLVGPGCVKVVR